MCGITGWVNYQKNLNELDTKVVERMTHTLGRRGPDATGIYTSDNAILGHKRLIVVDPLNGIQPMRYKNYTLIYNGELYNTEDIRKDLLDKGYTFDGHSDTEVLLKAYVEYKENVLEHLNGIFAFGIWDGKRLFLARDRAGVKPLFYKKTKYGLIFGSELKAILEHPDVEPIITLEGLKELLGLGPSRTPGHGIFKGLNELRAAHYLILTDDDLIVKRYWQVKSEKFNDTYEESVSKVKELVTDAVRKQLVSDVPLCTFLSGGLDSSIISALAALEFSEKNEQLTTYSIDYEGNKEHFKKNDYQVSSDNHFIKLVSDKYKTNHIYEVIKQVELVDYLDEAFVVRDTPGMVDIDSSLLWFCEQIKEQFTVSLSGECADEIFGGYPWFYKKELKNLDTFPWMRYISEREKLINIDWRDKLNIKEYVAKRYNESLLEVPHIEGETEEEFKMKNLFYLNLIWFMPTLLDRKDRMSMGASLEVRVPFADHRIIEYLWNVPWEYKYNGDREKGLLRDAFKDVLPEEIANRKKNPYPKTHNPVYANIVVEKLQDRLKNKDSILYTLFDINEINKILETKGSEYKYPYFGQLMTGPQLIAYLYQFDKWFDTYNVKLEID